ncbi:MAG: ATP-binding protein [Candidatus Woesearchaeota archaeon]
MIQDIFDVDNIESVVRQKCKEGGMIDLSKYTMTPFELSEDYIIKELHLPSEDYDSSILTGIKKILKIAETAGFDRHRLTSPIFEGCRNAHQHGNLCNPEKKITVGYNIVPKKSLDIVIIDEGGMLNPEFLPYILRHRQGLHRTNHVNFYEFCNVSKPKNNLGEGTALIHSTYLDSVKYYKSDKGGLVVHLSKRK